MASLIHGNTRILQHCIFQWEEHQDGRRVFTIEREHCEPCVEELIHRFPAATILGTRPMNAVGSVPPVELTAAAGGTRTTGRRAAVAKSTGSYILVVDDDDDHRRSLAQLLELAGYIVETAIHGGDALDRLTAAKALPALILLDLEMPVLSGEELVDSLRRAPRLRDIPVIVVTGNTPDRAVVDAVASCLSKPVPPRDLLELVDRIAGPKLRGR